MFVDDLDLRCDLDHRDRGYRCTRIRGHVGACALEPVARRAPFFRRFACYALSGGHTYDSDLKPHGGPWRFTCTKCGDERIF